MNLLLKSATILDPKSDFHNKTLDILIEKGFITKIASRIANSHNYKSISLPNLHVSQGWFDSSVSLGEPGYEERETLANGLDTAAKSGFTTVAVNPNTNPITSTNADVSLLKAKSKDHAINLLPIGALTKASNGERLTELFDMQNAGAVAFGDYQVPLANANLLKIALQYASNFDGLVCSFPLDMNVAKNGVMHEYITSTTIGLNGIPSMAEEMQIARDLSLLEYTEGKLHIPTISTKGSVDLIRQAKKKKLNVTCSVAIHNLIYTDQNLMTFNTNFKVLPPLRTAIDAEALIEGLKDGTIDMVTSDHNPLNIELKKTEFDHAEYGSIGLESAFGALNSIVSTKAAIKYLTRGKERFKLKDVPISIGNKVNMTLFDPDIKYIFEEDSISSKSKNTIFKAQPLKGKAYGIINNNKLILN